MRLPSFPAARRTTLRPGRRSIGALATVAVASGVLSLGAAPVQATTAGSTTAADVAADVADPASRFTLAVVPDTQFYSRYARSQFERPDRYGAGNNPFAVQTKWLAEHADELRIPFVAHLGDVVDQVGQTVEWQVADQAMKTLDDADLPYSILAGNHDVRNSSDDLYDDQYSLSQEPYLTSFGPARSAQQSTYVASDPTGFNQAHVFTAEGQQFMVLALSWRASDATLRWADDVMAKHPDVPVVLTSHDIVNIEPDGVTPRETANGLRLWDRLIRGNDQIFMTLNGHYHGASRLVKTNDAGHDVTQIVMDYQMAYEGGNGYLGLFEFDLTNDTVSVQTASPWVVQKPKDKLTSYDRAFLDGPNQQFTLDIDFAQRFAGFDPAFGAGTADEPSLVQEARDLLLADFTEPDAEAVVPAGSAEDYPKVPGTLAHWRLHGHEGVLAPGESVPDVAAGADLTRVSIAGSGSPTAQPGDVVVTRDASPFSSDGAAMCFTGSSKATDRFSYLVTDPAAAVNGARLEGGYTIETFLKLDAGWNSDENSWMKAIVRSGNRSTIGVPQSRWDWTASPTALGLSNLKELQWTEIPVETAKGDRTAWSGEIVLDRWVHVALVNDPASRTTTMYVDGAPVLRNATDTLGHGVDQDMPWLFGADWVDDQATNGWEGCIGETRVVDRPIPRDQWLTARADLTGLVVTSPQAAEPARARHEVTGTGLAGATVTLTGDVTGTTVVGEDGRWSVRHDAALAPGTYAVQATQSLGTRAADPVTVGFTVAGGTTELSARIGQLLAEDRISRTAAASVLDRVSRAGAAADAGHEAAAIGYLEQALARAANQLKGDADDAAVRDEITAWLRLLLDEQRWLEASEQARAAAA